VNVGDSLVLSSLHYDPFNINKLPENGSIFSSDANPRS
jgi:hypothetical protein